MLIRSWSVRCPCVPPRIASPETPFYSTHRSKPASKYLAYFAAQPFGFTTTAFFSKVRMSLPFLLSDYSSNLCVTETRAHDSRLTSHARRRSIFSGKKGYCSARTLRWTWEHEGCSQGQRSLLLRPWVRHRQTRRPCTRGK